MANSFNVRKAAQVAAYFALEHGGKIDVLKLVKLIYLADREFMTRYDCMILNDKFVSMDHGPVNLMTLNYIDGCTQDRRNWDAFISDRDGYAVGLTKPNMKLEELDELSDAEVEVLGQVWGEFGHMNKWEIRDYTHENCPEWEDPEGSSAPIPYERVFKFLGKKNGDYLARRIRSEREIDTLLAEA